MKNPDVVVIGAGIGGSALSIVLARAGVDVLLLEKTRVHKDVVRGEWLSPWGVAEANQLALTPLYEAHGAHRIDTHIGFSEFEDADTSAAKALPMNVEGLERPLCLGHPKTCNLLNEEARSLGVTVQRGITRLQVRAGEPPEVQYTHEGESLALRPRLVVGADGRNGIVARQLGIETSSDPEHHLFSGMLVEGAHDWPQDVQAIGTEGDAHVLAFPQGEGRVRIYLGWPSEDRARLVGPEGPQRFLDSWQLNCVPNAEAIYNATPASPCIAYPNSDSWTDRTVLPGVVLIGDAAGRNDPIIGQGLSITHRDVRLVSQALLANDAWAPSIFDEYVEERSERLGRLRICARLTSLREAAFGEGGKRLRHAIHERLTNQPDLAAPFAAAFIGPEQLPAEVFAPEFTAMIAGGDIWDPSLEQVAC